MFKIHLSENKKEYYFNLLAQNGQVILTSELYTSKSNCQNGIESVKNNASIMSRFERKTASNGKFYFNLKSSNGQVIGSSQMYSSEAGMENGINSVINNAPQATVEDTTI
ncbi:YegP family protein [Galbibacter mesophilus]|uniref:YegP family protein n=1 Tax=Galbibacter mesophilus TaxID=379069 RepID=UPI00191D5F43|nr:YegP family protein [Galbibacter mesophilus]MCM5663585.1 YegP family protein [Galbibacter mesophilus]